MIRSYLYVPGDRPELFDKAFASDAHAIILDLEDSVASPAKDQARQEVERALVDRVRSETRHAVYVRIDPDALADDLAVATAGRPDGIVVAKATLATVLDVSDALAHIEASSRSHAIPLTALIESARGILDAPDIATHARVERLALGEADLCADLGLTPRGDRIELAPYRAMVVLASAAAGLGRPTGPVGTDFRDLEQFRESCAALKRQGFGGRSAIHPAQLTAINECFAPTAAEVEHARALIAAFDAGVAAGASVQIGPDGSMLDEAVVRSARRIVDGQ